MGYEKGPGWKKLWAMEIVGCTVVCVALYAVGKVFGI